MTLNKFGKFEMTNTQTESVVGGKRNDRKPRCLTAAPAIQVDSPVLLAPNLSNIPVVGAGQLTVTNFLGDVKM